MYTLVMLRKGILFGCFLLLSLCCGGNAYSAAITNDECMACHGEKGLTSTGSGEKTTSLYFNKESFATSVHENLQCVKCHEINEIPHAPKLKAVSCRICHESSYRVNHQSVHRDVKDQKTSCKGCHGYHEIEKAKALTSSACADCHKTAYSDYRTGIHAHKSQESKEVASCMDCHGSHDVFKVRDPRSPVYHLNLPLTCSRCHADASIVEKYKIPAKNVYALYMDSIHGRAITHSGLLVSANCSDCHGAHAIKPHTDPTSRIYPQNIPSTCGKCHAGIEVTFEKSVHGQKLKKGNKNAPSCSSCHPAHQIQSSKSAAWVLDAIRECGSCHSALLETYRHSYHGKITNLGFTRVAKCADCHGAHEILPRKDLNSTISENNLLETCRKCHPKANKSFTEFIVHADYKSKSEHHGLYYIWLFMTILLVGVFGFFFIHTLLWLLRSWIERFRERQSRDRKTTETQQNYFFRLNYFHRIMHAIVMFSFLGLALTGLPLKYSDRSWAHYLVYFIGGFQAAGYFHRLFALVTFGYFIAHLIHLVHFFKYKSTEPFITFLFGPDSMVPRLKDFQDLYNNVKWFIGFGPRPKFDRWTYWEKFDYWAVFWGVTMIGISGLFLWFPTFFARFFPGWILNVATIVHSDEALLATGFIFVFHFTHTHLRGDKFPLDPAIFTGRITEEEFQTERPVEYERLKQNGTLEKMRADPPALWLKNMARIVGFSGLAVGIFIIFLIIRTLF